MVIPYPWMRACAPDKICMHSKQSYSMNTHMSNIVDNCCICTHKPIDLFVFLPYFICLNSVLINRNRILKSPIQFLINWNWNFEKSVRFIIKRNRNSGKVLEFWFLLRFRSSIVTNELKDRGSLRRMPT